MAINKKDYDVKIRDRGVEQIVNIVDFIRIGNKAYNKPHIDAIKTFRRLRKRLIQENDVSLYPHKAVFEYYTDVIERHRAKVFVLNDDQTKVIADFLKEIVTKEHKCEHKKRIRALLIEKLPANNIYAFNSGIGDDGLLITQMMQVIFNGLHLLHTVERYPVFEKSRDKKPYLEALQRIKKYTGMRYGKSFNAKLDQIERDIMESELIPDSKSKIHKSIYIGLILALSNLLFGKENGGLSPTYGAKDIAQDIMMQVFNTDAKHYSLPDDLPNNLHKFRESKLLGFYIYN